MKSPPSVCKVKPPLQAVFFLQYGLLCATMVSKSVESMEVGKTEKRTGLSGNILKIFALICMTADHVGLLLLPQYRFLRHIGRLAMPIFFYMIAEGCRYTKNKLRYLLTISAVAAVCQAVYFITEKSLSQCILVTFTLSVILIYALDFALSKRNVPSLALLALTFSALLFICVLLPKILHGFHVDYGFFGVMLPATVYLGKSKEEKLFLAACCLVGAAISMGLMQWLSLLSLPILYFYNGARGRLKLKYLFYIYYPLHLVAIYGISLLLQ